MKISNKKINQVLSGNDEGITCKQARQIGNILRKRAIAEGVARVEESK